ncbi:DUF4373 domain-containing protein [Collinsella sp. TF10-11AT]|uniref:Lin1244/Lin1753 domain-containing protein n=1 Tax=Collinsella sp. TF10-11AT TaxID=2292335 RepID=UPI000E43EC95|nr:Lin1244/Lin1753 domain-containing protein [Collinsella sp. TF10-11AT]RGK64694.1 DUF4373 domain-containing protein [Collinsella sp. TF10-11AT]
MTMIAKEVHDRAQDPMAWFQHDANASLDIKCQRLIMRHGNAAYGTYWRLCELLARTKHHALPVETDEDWLILATQIGLRSSGAFDETLSINQTRDFIDCLLEIGLLVRDGKGRIESERMQRNALYFGSQRANGAKGGRPRKNKAEPPK